MSFIVDPWLTLTLAGEDVDTAAWFCVNKADLIDASAPQRGGNEPLATDGTFPYAELDNEQTIDLRWVMNGRVDPDGVPYSDEASGLAQNKRLFKARYFRATRDAFGQVAAAGEDAAGQTVTGDVKLRNPIYSGDPYQCGVVMSVNIPAGELTQVVGSA